MKTQLLIILALLFFSCREGSESSRNARNSKDSLDADISNEVDGTGRRDTVNTESPEKHAFAEFGVSNGPVSLRLRDLKKNINLRPLGTPNDTLTREMTLITDPHKGSTVQEYKYEDINLEFFTPKGSTESWLMAMDIKGGNWSTARGIRVGDSITDLKNMYPKASNELSEDKTLYSYNVDNSVLTFAILDDKVSRIRVQYNVP